MKHLPRHVLDWMKKQDKLSMRFLQWMMCIYAFTITWALTRDLPLCR